MFVWLLKFGLIVLTGGAVFPSAAASNGSFIHTPFQKLPDKKEENVIFLLENAQTSLTNGTEAHIRDLSATYQIPVRIIQRLKRISYFQSDGLRLDTSQGQFTALKEVSVIPDPMKLDQEEWTEQIRLLANPNKSPYRETERGAAIRILGIIGGRQKIPPEVVYYLRDLMFEMENPNIRNNVVLAFKDMISLHPPDFHTMQKLAAWMKKLRETNKKITALRNRYFTLRKQYEQEGKSLPEIVEGIKLPPPFIGSLSENSQIYAIVEKIAQRHFVPDEIVNELGLALEGDENKPPGDSGTIILADNLLDALFAVAQRQGLPGDIIFRLEKLDSPKKYSSSDSVTPNGILTTPLPCRPGFLP